MAEIMDHDPILKPHTAILLAMLLQEDGTLTAERRHDCVKGVCYAIGIQGHHICHRGTPLVAQAHGKPKRSYCSWKGGQSPQKQFEEAYPGFSFDWMIQFEEYTQRMRSCLSEHGIERCVQSWNPREAGRVGTVKRHIPYVIDALGW